jgi:hypothetical protein
MSTEIMVIIIVAIAVSGVVKLARIATGTERQGRKHRHGAQALLDPAQPSPREQELQREVEDLRERIHVLERIATDGRQTHALAAEIESLRER